MKNQFSLRTKPLIRLQMYLLCLVFLLPSVAPGCIRKPSTPPRAQKKTVEPNDPEYLNAKKVEITLMDLKGRVCWKLKIAQLKEEKDGMHLLRVEGDYLPEDESAPASIVADQGIILPDMSGLELSGGVILSRHDLTLRADKLTWGNSSEELALSGSVRIQTAKIQGQGELMTTDANMDHIKMEGKSHWKVSAPDLE
jgi:hypothetical protein